MNLKEIEKLLLKHLEESGQIRADLNWLKKSYWIVMGAIMVQVAVTLWK